MTKPFLLYFPDCAQSLTLAHSLVGREPWLGRAWRSKARFSRSLGGVLVFSYLKIVTFLALSMIINQSQPIRGQYTDHVITHSQSEARNQDRAKLPEILQFPPQPNKSLTDSTLNAHFIYNLLMLSLNMFTICKIIYKVHVLVIV